MFAKGLGWENFSEWYNVGMIEFLPLLHKDHPLCVTHFESCGRRVGNKNRIMLKYYYISRKTLVIAEITK